jgi:probable phosphoglycerate mutase
MPASSQTLVDTSLYFVRHGETEYNRRGIMQGGGIDSTLNDTGRRQAEHLADRLRETTFDAVYASTLRRARETADILAAPHEPIRREFLDDLQEMSWGVFEGTQPSAERDEKIGAIKSAWRNGAYDRPVEGGESILDVQERALRAVRHLMDEEAGRTILVVTHGRYLRVLLASVLEDYGLDQMHEFGHANTCVNRLVHDGDRFRADLLNCTAHLES